MPRKAKRDTTTVPSDGSRVDAFAIPCVVRSPLGYWHLAPEDGRTLDEAILQARSRMRLEPGEHVVVTIMRKKP